MKLPTRFSFIFIWVLFFSILFTQNLFASDWEYWSKNTIIANLNEKIELKLQPDFRFKNEFGNFYFQQTYVGPVFKISEFLKIAPLYLYRTTKKNNHWKKNNIGNLDIELKLPFLLESFLIYRCRTEYNFTKESCVLRNAFKLSKDCKKIAGLSFFLSDEIFYNFMVDKLNENRTEIGFSKEITDNLGLGLSYILRYREIDNWRNTNILQTEVKVAF